MRISTVVEALAGDLVALGRLGDEATAAAAERLAAAMQGPITARLLDSLGQLAAELSRTVRDGRVEVRLMGGDADLVWVEDPSAEAGPEEDVDADANARITLRLPAALKSRIEAASARDGVSVNTYIVRALGQQSRPDRGPKVGKRLTGYGRS
ncbi:MAG TPA: toxin-antitoxin system HicB family antitoxin [Acidimicrobiales bacterium]|nr:toxin-antitoxin system HicB family antitoxin [Acidimicrobiales bacterium]